MGGGQGVENLLKVQMTGEKETSMVKKSAEVLFEGKEVSRFCRATQLKKTAETVTICLSMLLVNLQVG